MVMPPMWVHFYGVGVSALAATAAAVALTTAGARQGDTRTVIVGGAFSLMAALLAVHGLVTPGVLLGPNGLIAVTGAATLPVGGAVLALSALPRFNSPRAIPRVIALQGVVAVAIVGLSLVGALVPSLTSGLTRFDITSLFFVGELVGVLCILAGIMLTIERPTRRPSV